MQQFNYHTHTYRCGHADNYIGQDVIRKLHFCNENLEV
jgi:hypothetical protein